MDNGIETHTIDVIRALAEVCVPPLTVARLFELLERERNETVRRGLVEVIRQRAARGEGREVAECYVRMMVRRGASELTAERVQKAVGVSLRVAGEVLMEYARGGVYRTRREGHRVTVYRLQPVENGQVSCEPVHWAGQDCCEPVHWAGQDGENPVQEGDSASGQVSCEPVHWAGQDCCEPVHLAGQDWEDPVQEEDSADGVVDSCDHNLLRAVAALAEQPRVLMHTAARVVSTHSGQALCPACDEVRRMLVIVRDEASAAECGARARGLLAQLGEKPEVVVEQYRLDGTYTEQELGWIPHILEIIEASGRIMPFYAALKVRHRLNLSQKETEAVQELIWRMARSGDAGLRVVGGTMVERVPIVE
jgi:hypothetical protein